ncbi:uncharacterized protein LOC108455600 [Gossypium arboreum]|uniref:uncharacterized protein LOC108455600 n=1 Tax=Gossypium arboreum TaxID=29729 RepID=UPI000818F3ED|nr:uncharacterized protein LOC108455600 [Gossypium arboreum]
MTTTTHESGTLRELASNFVKLDWFDGGNFQRWQKKMHFLLSSLKIAYVLDTLRPDETENESIAVTQERQKWNNIDYMCMGHILNGLSDGLFNTYQNKVTAKELWDKLETRYMTEDVTSKKFLVSHFNNYQMVDGRSVMKQFRDIEKMLNQFKQYDMKMDEMIVVSSIIDKLPLFWKDFKRSLKHKKDEISLEALANHLCIEE